MARKELTEKEADFVRWQRVARVATVDAAGMPHVVPVCPVYDGGKIYFATENNRKVRNLRSNRKVALAFDEYTEVWENLRGLVVQGKAARIIEEGPEFQRLQGLFYEKFPQYPTAAGGVTEGDTLIVEVKIESAAGEV
jgi:nitroimidazol reductase NimA-like FMN-containing flavoprotein (pyridoxamine 5'-phosphate oxidase superfamily)